MWTLYLTEELLFDVFHKEKAFARVYFLECICSFKGQSKLNVDVNKTLLCKYLCKDCTVVRFFLVGVLQKMP